MKNLSGYIIQLKTKNELVKVVAEFVELDKKGWACCPFHNEKNPSFHIHSSGEYWKCFGCGRGGDVIKFVQDIKSISFMDALKYLADRANMNYPLNT